MGEPDVKTLTIKMRGMHGSAKTEMLLAIARFARVFGMVPAVTEDGHNMTITSTKAQRVELHAFNHASARVPVADWPARRPLLPSGDVA